MSKNATGGEARPRRAVVVELDVPQFRADTDQRGNWYVWRRMGAAGWATLRRCDSREHALRLTSQLNDGYQGTGVA